MKTKSFLFTAILFLIIIINNNCMATNEETASQPKVPGLTLNNGIVMPQFGLGTFRLAEGSVSKNAVSTALKKGYRHIDTAHAYGNERSIGQAVNESGIPREEIWITSKLWPNEYGEGKTLPAIDKMLKRLNVDYIDLVYLHQPVGNYVGCWKELEKAVVQGKVRAIGISNFDYNDQLFDDFYAQMTSNPWQCRLNAIPMHNVRIGNKN